MTSKQSTTKQIESTFVGINQIIKALNSFKTKEDKDKDKEAGKNSKILKEEIKVKLGKINSNFISGSSIAPLYRLDEVKTALNLKLNEVDAIYNLSTTRSATSLKNELKKLEKQKQELDKRIKALKEELLK